MSYFNFKGMNDPDTSYVYFAQKDFYISKAQFPRLYSEESDESCFLDDDYDQIEYSGLFFRVPKSLIDPVASTDALTIPHTRCSERVWTPLDTGGLRFSAQRKNFETYIKERIALKDYIYLDRGTYRVEVPSGPIVNVYAPGFGYISLPKEIVDVSDDYIRVEGAQLTLVGPQHPFYKALDSIGKNPVKSDVQTKTGESPRRPQTDKTMKDQTVATIKHSAALVAADETMNALLDAARDKLAESDDPTRQMIALYLDNPMAREGLKFVLALGLLKGSETDVMPKSDIMHAVGSLQLESSSQMAFREILAPLRKELVPMLANFESKVDKDIILSLSEKRGQNVGDIVAEKDVQVAHGSTN